VAAALVVVEHTRDWLHYGGWLATKIALDQGVSFFFVLSGFILFYNNRDLRGASGAWRFIVARIARIFPVHLATLFLLVTFTAGPWGLSAGPTLANITLLQSWIPLPQYFFSYNAVAWSLSTEFFFYLMFPLLIWRWSQTWHIKLLASLGLTALMIVLTDRLHLKPFSGSQSAVSIDAMVYIYPTARLSEFVIGLVFAYAWVSWAKHLHRLPMLFGSALELVAVATAGYSMIYLLLDFDHLYSSGFISLAMLRWLSAAGSAPSFGLLIAVLALQRGFISKALSWRPFVLLGDISFALYMCHTVLEHAFQATGTLANFGGHLAQIVAYWTFALAMSYALFRLVEQPCRRVIFRLLMTDIRTAQPRKAAIAPPL
jgi:peptidoglycan/LPS O-acetylase OafA/YrhL